MMEAIRSGQLEANKPLDQLKQNFLGLQFEQAMSTENHLAAIES